MHTPLEKALSDLDNIEWFEDLILAKAGKPRPRPTILNDTGLLRQIMREANQLRKNARLAVDSAAMKARLRRSVNIDWRGAHGAHRARAIDEVANLIKGVPSEIQPGIAAILDREGKRVVSWTHEDVTRRHKSLKVIPNFAEKNEDAIKALRETQSMFFKPEYEARAVDFRERAQKVIADGLEQGFGRNEIAYKLMDEFQDVAVAESYWVTAASVHVTRARSWSSLKSYAESGLEQFEVMAVGDERTCDICSFMDGQVLSIEKAMDAFDDMEDAEDLHHVKTKLAPFISADDDGLVLPNGTRLATLGEDGEYEQAVEDLQDEGINAPPYHPRCRCTLSPVLEESE